MGPPDFSFGVVLSQRAVGPPGWRNLGRGHVASREQAREGAFSDSALLDYMHSELTPNCAVTAHFGISRICGPPPPPRGIIRVSATALAMPTGADMRQTRRRDRVVKLLRAVALLLLKDFTY